MELIQYAGRNWVIVEENEETLKLETVMGGVVTEITVPCTSPMLDLPIPEEEESEKSMPGLVRKIDRENHVTVPIYMDAIDELSARKSGKKKHVKYVRY